MMILLTVGIFAALAGGQQSSCSPVSRPVSISWSDRAELRSPACKWIVSVNPDASGQDGPADLILQNVASDKSHLIAKVNRDAVIHWNPDGNGLLLEDMAYSDHYRLLLFDPLSESSSESEATDLDKLIRKQVEENLGTSENINYLPRYVSWNRAGLIVSIGVVTIHGSSGPFTPHCYGFKIRVNPLSIAETLTEGQLKKEYKASCQIWP